MGHNLQLRVTLLGDGAVGKTSLRRRFLGKGFSTSHLQTIGADFATMKQEIGEYLVTYQIWDLAGEKSFQSVRARFFKGALGGLLVFDLTRRDTFHNIAKWINELWQHNGKGVVPIILLGNKSDLPNHKISHSDAEEYAHRLSSKTKPHGFEVQYLETSAKDGINVKEAFNTLGTQIINHLF